ncbi:MAG: hypothetical protein NC819_04470 [Candidatus Omnitrophica bacterium]|nr:hypothetical protein [Candidatus Omnitrophota bacterium]
MIDLNKFKENRLQFGRREKIWAVVLAAVVIVVWGNRLIVRPRAEAAWQARRAFVKASNELMEVEAKKPDLEAKRDRIRQLQQQVGTSYKDLEALEKGLLYKQDQDLLLERMVADRKRLDLAINAVEPQKVEEKKGDEQKEDKEISFYKQLLIQIDVSASYSNLIEYVKMLESQGPYQRIRGIRIDMEKEEKVIPRAKILAEVLLSDTEVRKSEIRQQVLSLIDEEAAARELKDPFLAQERPFEEAELVGLQLNGIFGTSSRLTALIDGSPYQEGDVIQGKRIVKIQPDRVVLEEGNKRYFLYERQAAR